MYAVYLHIVLYLHIILYIYKFLYFQFFRAGNRILLIGTGILEFKLNTLNVQTAGWTLKTFWIDP